MLCRDIKPRLSLAGIFALAVSIGLLGQVGAPPSKTPALDDVLTPVSKDGRWGYANSTGQMVIRPKYFAAEPFSEGLALVVTRKPWQPFVSEYGEFLLAQVTYIDSSGREIRPPLSVRRAHSFVEGRALVVPDAVLRMKGGCAKGGYLNPKGDWAIKPQFDGLIDFSEGLAAVNVGAGCNMGGKWGYIDKDGQTIIQFRFLWAGKFHNGRACVGEKPRQDEVIDRTGNVLPGEKCR